MRLRGYRFCIALFLALPAAGQTGADETAAAPAGAASSKAILGAPRSRILTVDRNAVEKALAPQDSSATDVALDTLLGDMLHAHGADLVVDRNAIVVGPWDVDVTIMCIDRLRGATPDGMVPTDLPQLQIAILDRAAVFRQSLVGESIQSQVDALTQSADDQFKAKNEAPLDDVPMLPGEASADLPKLNEAMAERRKALQADLDARKDQIAAAAGDAQRQVELVIERLTKGAMQVRGAAIVIDRSQVILGTPASDLTAVVVHALDATLQTYPITAAEGLPN
jgi:Skp family chaperone for outer membrane proteins